MYAGCPKPIVVTTYPLTGRWKTLFDAGFDVLLYDLTSTYFESPPTGSGKRQYGYSLLLKLGAAKKEAGKAYSLVEITLPKPHEPVKELKHNLSVRPIFHQIDKRVDAHIFVCFMAYSLLTTFKHLADKRLLD